MDLAAGRTPWEERESSESTPVCQVPALRSCWHIYLPISQPPASGGGVREARKRRFLDRINAGLVVRKRRTGEERERERGVDVPSLIFKCLLSLSISRTLSFCNPNPTSIPLSLSLTLILLLSLSLSLNPNPTSIPLSLSLSLTLILLLSLSFSNPNPTSIPLFL